MARSFRNFTERLKAIDLYDEIEAQARECYVTLPELFEGPDKAPSIVAARRTIYKWLMKEGKGLNEVARLFDRAPSGVLKLVRGRK